LLAHLVKLSLGNDVAALPIVAPIQHDENTSRIESTQRVNRITGPAGKPKPQDIHRRAKFLNGQSGPRAHHRMPPIGTYDQVSANL